MASIVDSTELTGVRVAGAHWGTFYIYRTTRESEIENGGGKERQTEPEVHSNQNVNYLTSRKLN